MNFKFFRTKSTIILLFLAILLSVGLFSHLWRGACPKVHSTTEEVTANVLDQGERCSHSPRIEKERLGKQFLLNRDYEKAYNVLQELVTENDLSIEEYESISFALIFTCLILHNYDEAMLQSNRLENMSQAIQWKLLNVFVNIHSRNYDGAIEKLTQIEQMLENDTQHTQIDTFDDASKMIVFLTRSAMHLSKQQYERSKVDLVNLLRVVELNADNLPDDFLRHVNMYRECFDLYTTHPGIYNFCFDDTLPLPEKSTDDEKVILGIVLVWELVSTVDGSIVHTCSIAL